MMAGATPTAAGGSLTLSFGWDETKQKCQKGTILVEKMPAENPDPQNHEGDEGEYLDCVKPCVI